MGDQRQIEYCLNCGTPLEQADQYCGSCGQKTHDGKLPLLKLLREFASDQLNLDGKLLHTFRALLFPGRLTREYFAGKRKRQINPISLFFITVLLGLAALQFSDIDLEMNQLKTVLGTQTNAQSLNTIDSLKKVLETRQIPNSDLIIRDLMDRMQVNTDSINLVTGELSFPFDRFENKLPDSLKVSRRDLELWSPTQIVNNAGVTGLTAIYLRQKIKLMKEPGSLLRYIFSNLAWIYLCYIPVVALILKLLYLRRNRFYIEHFLFSLHMHTAFIFMLMLAGLFSGVTNEISWSVIFLLFAIYLYMGMRRFYNQGRFKTVSKFIILQIFYPVLLTFFIIAAGLVSLLFF